eukprot:TRINITY_DN2766_c0_g1_i1.p1 TRINITY_DN2766_c0_g1~~TRINITY_DN2766_c0_g1_i1.p1  ORF type:complete len:588 (+),score=102.98 TRINITY_DN2766_c0_g1_i1:96-1766(+)
MDPNDKELLLDWVVNRTRDSSWDITEDPCSWPGISCYNGTYLQSIDISPEVLQNIVWGDFPDLPVWSQKKKEGTALPHFVYIKIKNCRLGPYLPDWAEDYWTTYDNNNTNTVAGFNFELDTTPSILCPFPVTWNISKTRERKVSCTNVNIIDLSPRFGPAEGNTKVYIRLNAPSGYINLTCSFGAYDDHQTIPVPIKDIFFSDYQWADFANATSGNIGFSESMISCVSPRHTPGTVNLTLWVGNSLITTTFLQTYNYECPAGTYASNATGNCEDCPLGYWSPVKSTKCYPCPPGSYADVMGSPECTLCPAGSFNKLNASTDASNCTKCDPGYYTSKPGSTKCSPCSPGTSQIDKGMPSCDQCKQGYFAEGYANTNCSKCNPGSYSDSEGNPSCLKCEVGKFTGIYGSTFCAKCLAGTTTSGVGSTTCDVECQPGFFRPVQISRCIRCIPGQYANGTANAVCKLCSVGYYNPYFNASSCIKCPNGTLTTNKGSTSCIPRIVPPPPKDDNVGFVVGIVLLVIAIVLIFIAIVYVIYKRRQQAIKQREIDQIRDIMNAM